MNEPSSFWRSAALVLGFVVTVQYLILITRDPCDRSTSNDPLNQSGFFLPTSNIVDVTVPTTSTVLLLTSISVISSGMGGLPFFFFKKLSPFWICFYNSVAAGI